MLGHPHCGAIDILAGSRERALQIHKYSTRLTTITAIINCQDPYSFYSSQVTISLELARYCARDNC